jgi:flagellar M-ring protein FliF
MNFDTTKETVDSFNPDQQVPRSTQTVSDDRSSTQSTPTVSVANNLPGAQPASQGAGSREKRQEETTNFEIGHDVRTVVHDTPDVARISLAVMVADVATRQKDGSITYAPRPQAELDQIAALVKTAIGYDAKRGDNVTIVSMRMPEDAGFASKPDSAVHSLVQMLLSPDTLTGLAQTLVLALVALLAVLLVFRPVMLRLTAAAPAPTPAALPASAAGLPELAAPADAGQVASMPRIEGAVPAASLKNLADLVEHHPDETLSIIRAWLAESAD